MISMSIIRKFEIDDAVGGRLYKGIDIIVIDVFSPEL